MTDSVEQKIREAHEAMPCRPQVCCHGCSDGFCRLYFTAPGHAAIDAALGAAFAAGKQHTQDEMNRRDSGLMGAFDSLPLPAWLPKEGK